MDGYAEIVLHHRGIEAFAPIGLLGQGRRIEHIHSLGSARVELSPLETGRHFLEQWPVRELPSQGAWRHDAYNSYAPPIFVVHDALVHSSAGIVAVGDQVILDTMGNTSPETHGFRNLMRGLAIHPKSVRRLAGAHVSLLTGGEGNYYHSMLLGLARLGAVPENYQAAAASLLVPHGAARQKEVLALLDLMPSLAVDEVARDETLLVETLILPLGVCMESAFHPCVVDFFNAISTNVTKQSRPTPARIYIERTDALLRPLVNERDLAAALAGMGFVAVRPETMSVVDQVRLFRGAETIVAPHGAGLTNLGFCRPGTRVIELLSDAYCNWCFRNLAGLMQLDYDCILGRSRKPWPDLDVSFHRTPWQISVNHVVAAVAQTGQRAAA
jgi:capsular polysaccharide biosynthesis protein